MTMQPVRVPPDKQTRSLSEDDARVVASVLDQLVSRDGRVTPESFLEAATPEDSPLHLMFEWDDGKAAREHRLHQARQIVRTVVYRSVRLGGESRAVSLQVTRPVLSPVPVRAAPSQLPVGDGSPQRAASGTVKVVNMRAGKIVVEQPLTPDEAVGDREVFLVGLAPVYSKVGSDLTMEDVARMCWDAGHVRATLCEE
jgi:hypothetical protein